ncbi:hypothetical protein Tco_1043095 [Tanacetum coccineum]|uniref:Uncharacterized protein n=1 Tax=Tanacetum coccineum TaxID=301880 RepID=A0ABQ5GL32_9ASTR
MSSITAQQTKLDLELVPKEKILDIRKCNGRLNTGKIQREPTFQVVLDALALTPRYSAFLITADVSEVYMHQFWDSVYKPDTFYKFKIDKRKRFKLNMESQWEIHSHNDIVVDQMHQPWRTFAALINKSLSGKTSEETQIYGAILPDSLTSLEMKETKAYKTYLEPTRKSKRVNRPAKKTTKAPARGVVIRETPEIPVSKKKEKVDVTQGKGIELLSQVALTEDAQFKEVRKKSMRDFYKTHPSGSGTITKTAPSASKIKPSVTSEGTSGNNEDDRNNEQESSGEDSDQKNDSDDDKTQSDNENESNSEHETDENESGFESDQDKNEEDENDEEEVNDELVKTLSNDYDDEDETKITDKAEGDEDEEMDYTTSQLYDDVDIRLNEPVDSDKGFVQEEAKFLNFSDIPHTDAEVVSLMDVHVHHEVPSQQTPILLTVPVSVISDSSTVFSTVILQSLPSFTSPPQQSTPTPPPTTEAMNPQSALPNFASVFQFNNRVTALEKEVAELKKDPFYTQVTALVDDHLDARLGATIDEF